MRVLFVGLGKLGLPVALALKAAGHDVIGCEINQLRTAQIDAGQVPDGLQEPYVAEYLKAYPIPVFPSVSTAVGHAWTPPEVVLVAVQTPHQPQFEGTTPLLEPPEDFDYTHLRWALTELKVALKRDGLDPLVVTISTCLPGTYEREIKPLVEGMRYAYNPLFIAMGSVIDDFRNPEFILIGHDPPQRGWGGELLSLYGPVTGIGDAGAPPVCSMSITSAELTKVAYNAFIGSKIMLANGVAMVSDATGADADDVMNTLKLATDRLISPTYLRPGMGDSGACHPRDQIALSWLARSLDLHDPYDPIIRHREAHAEWLADLWWDVAAFGLLPMVMLGTAYKPNSTIQTGSHALLVAHYVQAKYPGGQVRLEDQPFRIDEPACFFLATPHDYFVSMRLPEGSVLVDPWGLFEEQEGVQVIRPGRQPRERSRDAETVGDVQC